MHGILLVRLPESLFHLHPCFVSFVICQDDKGAILAKCFAQSSIHQPAVLQMQMPSSHQGSATSSDQGILKALCCAACRSRSRQSQLCGTMRFAEFLTNHAPKYYRISQCVALAGQAGPLHVARLPEDQRRSSGEVLKVPLAATAAAAVATRCIIMRGSTHLDLPELMRPALVTTLPHTAL